MSTADGSLLCVHVVSYTGVAVEVEYTMTVLSISVLLVLWYEAMEVDP